MTENIPPNFRIEDDRLVNEKTKEYFLIRNRSLDEINHTFRGFIKKIVPAMIAEFGKDNVKVLDIGGGQESKAAKELSKLGVNIVNADLIAKPSDKKTNLFPIPASVFNLPFKDSTFDFLYTRQLLPYFDEKKNDLAIYEIARVMKPGSIALLDEPFYSFPKYYKTDIKNLEKAISAKVTIFDSGLFLGLPDRLQKLFDPDMFPPGKFLLVQKLPVNLKIDKIIKSIPQKLQPWKTT